MILNRYRYYFVERPKSLGDLPSGSNLRRFEIFPERRYVAEIDRMVWGFVECETLLTPMEVSEYELISAPREVE